MNWKRGTANCIWTAGQEKFAKKSCLSFLVVQVQRKLGIIAGPEQEGVGRVGVQFLRYNSASISSDCLPFSLFVHPVDLHRLGWIKFTFDSDLIFLVVHISESTNWIGTKMFCLTYNWWLSSTQCKGSTIFSVTICSTAIRCPECHFFHMMQFGLIDRDY